MATERVVLATWKQPATTVLPGFLSFIHEPGGMVLVRLSPPGETVTAEVRLTRAEFAEFLSVMNGSFSRINRNGRHG